MFCDTAFTRGFVSLVTVIYVIKAFASSILLLSSSSFQRIQACAMIGWQKLVKSLFLLPVSILACLL